MCCLSWCWCWCWCCFCCCCRCCCCCCHVVPYLCSIHVLVHRTLRISRFLAVIFFRPICLFSKGLSPLLCSRLQVILRVGCMGGAGVNGKCELGSCCLLLLLPMPLLLAVVSKLSNTGTSLLRYRLCTPHAAAVHLQRDLQRDV